MDFDFSFKTNNDQNRNRYRAEEEKKYDPTFEDDHSEGYTNVQNGSQKRDKDLRCRLFFLFRLKMCIMAASSCQRSCSEVCCMLFSFVSPIVVFNNLLYRFVADFVAGISCRNTSGRKNRCPFPHGKTIDP